MYSINNYKNLKIVSPTPASEGGQALNDNFIYIADLLENGVSGTVIDAPNIKLDNYNKYLIYFTDRPTGATVRMYKKTRYKKGPHVKGIKASKSFEVVAASTENIDINSTLTSIDGYTLQNSDINNYVLLKNQNDIIENGVYKILDNFNIEILKTSNNVKRDFSKSAVLVLKGNQINTLWIGSGSTDNCSFDLIENTDRERLPNRQGKRVRYIEDLGAIDQLDILAYWKSFLINPTANTRRTVYYFAYYKGNSQGLYSFPIRVNIHGIY